MQNDSVTKKVSYRVKDKNIISDFSLDIDKGTFLTIIGPSGGGKSTLLKLLANLISPTSGEIDFKDENINTYSPTIYRRQVSYCFQQPSLFGETVKENLEFPFKIRKQQPGQDKMEQALKSVDLKPDFLNKNITELGLVLVYSNNSTIDQADYCLYTHALIRDNQNRISSITVLQGEILEVNYTIDCYYNYSPKKTEIHIPVEENGVVTDKVYDVVVQPVSFREGYAGRGVTLSSGYYNIEFYGADAYLRSLFDCWIFNINIVLV